MNYLWNSKTQNLLAGAGALKVSIDGPSRVEMESVEDEDRVCTIGFTPVQAGTYILTVLFSNTHVLGPFRSRSSHSSLMSNFFSSQLYFHFFFIFFFFFFFFFYFYLFIFFFFIFPPFFFSLSFSSSLQPPSSPHPGSPFLFDVKGSRSEMRSIEEDDDNLDEDHAYTAVNQVGRENLLHLAIPGLWNFEVKFNTSD